VELRVGIGENHWRSLTFKIWTQGEESYAICREVPQEKQSFHRSGITRFAKITDGPRPPIHSSYLPVLRGDRYCTVGRLILTTEDNLGPARDLVRKHSFCAKHSDGLDSSVFAIGFTNCHPEQGNGIDLPENNIVTAKLSEHKYLTVTYEKQDLGTTLCSLKKHNLGPMSSSSIITTKKANPFDPSLTDFLSIIDQASKRILYGRTVMLKTTARQYTVTP